MPKLLRLGTVNGEPLIVDIGYLGGDRAPVSVTLTADYVLEDPGAGWPAVRHFLAGRYPSFPHIAPSGTTISLLKCEADALVQAGAATYA